MQKQQVQDGIAKLPAPWVDRCALGPTPLSFLKQSRRLLYLSRACGKTYIVFFLFLYIEIGKPLFRRSSCQTGGTSQQTDRGAEGAVRNGLKTSRPAEWGLLLPTADWSAQSSPQTYDLVQTHRVPLALLC